MADQDVFGIEQEALPSTPSKASSNRDAIIVRTSIIGIIANAFLAAFKAAIGIFTNSIAILLDAVNNLTDAFSSVVTIIGTKLANKEPDRKHPYGHGRIEYLTTIVISVIIMYAGVTALLESITRIIKPEVAQYDTISLVIVAVAVLVKIILGRYVKSVGMRVESDSLVASGTDALMDAIISAATLVAALVYIGTGVALEAWLGAIISLVIIKAGIDILREAMSKIIGQRVDAELTHGIKETICSVDGVHGAYDLILNDYGPQRLTGSVHIQVDEDVSAREIDAITRAVQRKVYDQHHVIVHTVGIYSENREAEGDVREIREDIDKVISEHEEVLQVHGFYVDEEVKRVNFDLVLNFDAKNRKEVYAQIVREIQELHPDYRFQVVLDADITD